MYSSTRLNDFAQLSTIIILDGTEPHIVLLPIIHKYSTSSNSSLLFSEKLVTDSEKSFVMQSI